MLYNDPASYSVQSNGDLASSSVMPFNACRNSHRCSYLPPRKRPLGHSRHPSATQAHRRRQLPSSTKNRIVCQSIGGQSVPVVYGGAKLTAYGNLTGKRLAALIGLRDKARRVLQSQNEGWPESTAAKLAANSTGLRPLRRRYGPINKTTFGETEAAMLFAACQPGQVPRRFRTPC